MSSLAKLLNDKLKTSEFPTASNNIYNILGQLNRYIMDANNIVCNNSLAFWEDKKGCYSKLFMLAQDLVTAPASPVYFERIVSVCGAMTS